MIERTIIPGPPGTGKTYRLVNTYLKDEVEKHKTPLKKVGFFTFSKNASEIAKKRTIKFFPTIDWDRDLEYFSTLHALGKRECGLETKTQLLKGDRWNAFKNYDTWVGTLNFETYYIGDQVFHRNEYMKLIDLARARKISLSNQYNLQEHTKDISYQDLDYLYRALIKFKNKTGMFEFIDMILTLIDKYKNDEKYKKPVLDAIFLDEAQDLNNLQWELFHCLEANAKRSYIAGDDDQAIMLFQGANPAHFIKLHNDKNTTVDKSLVKSRRVPRRVLNLAKQILNKIPSKERVPKQWEARDFEGTVNWVSNYEHIDYSKGQWMIMTRTNKMLDPLKDFFEDKGFYYGSKHGNDLISQNLLEAINTWKKLNKGEPVQAKQAKKLYTYMTCKGKKIAKNFGKGITLNPILENLVNIEDLRNHHGLLATGSWDQAFDTKISSKKKEFILTLQRNGENLSPTAEPRIKLSTIHGSKGDERQNTVLMLDIDYNSFNAYQEDPSPEHRLFFVGITRTFENLYIVNQSGEYGYRI
jgi:superfamily I DNA/RNA helicase